MVLQTTRGFIGLISLVCRDASRKNRGYDFELFGAGPCFSRC